MAYPSYARWEQVVLPPRAAHGRVEGQLDCASWCSVEPTGWSGSELVDEADAAAVGLGCAGREGKEAS